MPSPSHGDQSEYTSDDLTVTYLAKVTKGRHKIEVQVTKIAEACEQLRATVESSTYAVTAAQWRETFAAIEKEVNETKAHVDRIQEKRDNRRGLRYVWENDRLVKEH